MGLGLTKMDQDNCVLNLITHQSGLPDEGRL